MPDFVEIKDLNLPELQVYAITSEVQLLRYFEPEPGLFIAETARVIARALDAGYEPLSMLVEKRQLENIRRKRMGRAEAGEDLSDIIERCGDIPIYVADLAVLTQITGFALTRGVLCAMRRHPLPDAEMVCRHASRIAVLEEIMNPTNVGAVFRSAAALGFDGVLLTEGCCDPLYRRAVRVSMGTVFQIPWAYLENAGRPELEGRSGQQKSEGQSSGRTSFYVERLKSMGFAAAAMALTDDSVGIDDPDLMAEERLAVILGTEGEGLRDSTIRACDYTVKIPMAHGVDSLNVAAASAVAFWQLGKREKSVVKEEKI